MRHQLVLGSTLSLIFGVLNTGCATSGTVTSESTGVGGSTGSDSGPGGTGGRGGSGGSFTTTDASSSVTSGDTTSSASSSSASSSTSSGTGGSDPCAKGCDAGFVDADKDPATGTCGCEYACAMGCPGGTIDADKDPSTGLCGCEHSCATMGCPTNFFDADGNPLTGVCGCEYACVQVSPNTDPIDDQFKDDNCDGTDGVAEKCVYVSASQGSDGAAGTRMAPVKSIAKALSVAQTNGVPSVCLSGETYNEAVTVVSGINIYGGFDQNDPDFKFRRSANVTTTVAAMGTVFNAPKIDQETHIEGITIEAAPTPVLGGSTR